MSNEKRITGAEHTRHLVKERVIKYNNESATMERWQSAKNYRKNGESFDAMERRKRVERNALDSAYNEDMLQLHVRGRTKRRFY